MEVSPKSWWVSWGYNWDIMRYLLVSPTCYNLRDFSENVIILIHTMNLPILMEKLVINERVWQYPEVQIDTSILGWHIQETWHVKMYLTPIYRNIRISKLDDTIPWYRMGLQNLRQPQIALKSKDTCCWGLHKDSQDLQLDSDQPIFCFILVPSHLLSIALRSK